MSSAARPTADERFLSTGWSSRYLRYSSGISPETWDRRNTSPSRRYSWATCASQSRAASSRTVSSTSPGLATARPSAARIFWLAFDWWRASFNSCRNESLVTRVVRDECSLGTAMVPPFGPHDILCPCCWSGCENCGFIVRADGSDRISADDVDVDRLACHRGDNVEGGSG